MIGEILSDEENLRRSNNEGLIIKNRIITILTTPRFPKVEQLTPRTNRNSQKYILDLAIQGQ